jgi:flagellar hook-basal body complex protein FliE
MTPLPAISHTLPAHGIQPRPEIAFPQTMRAPGVDGPAPVGPPMDLNPGQPASESFGNMLGRFVTEVNSRQNAAAEAVQQLQTGGCFVDQVIAMEEASVSFQLMVEVRNKLLESYQELMRMQV